MISDRMGRLMLGGGGGVDSQGPLDVLQERTEEEWGEPEERLAAQLHATLGRTANSRVS